jgi:hypothetical protein
MIKGVLTEAVFVDTSNCCPHCDGKIEAIEAVRVESLWVIEHWVDPS